MSAAAVKDEAAAHRFAKDHLKAFVERVERLEEEKKALSDDIRDVYAEAKANGFDVKALRTIVRLRKQDKDERAEQEAILETYLHALGMLNYVPERGARSEGGRGTATSARAQACDFASDAVIRTTLPAPAKGDHQGQSAAGGPQRPTKAAKQPGEPAAGAIESKSASAPRSPYSLAPAAPDADEGEGGDGRSPCPASHSNSAQPLNGSLPAGESEPAVTRALGCAEPEHPSPPSDGDRPRPETVTKRQIPPGGADDPGARIRRIPTTDPGPLPDFLRIGDPANAWLRKTTKAHAAQPPP